MGYTGEGFVDFKPNQPGGTLTWDVEILSADNYSLQFKYAHVEGNRPLEVKVNGEIIVEGLAFEWTGDWASWEVVKIDASLVGGSNKIEVKGTGVFGGGNIDHLKVIGGATESDEVTVEFEVVSINDMLSKPIVDYLSSEGLFIDGAKTNKMAKGDSVIESMQAITDSLVFVTFNSGFLKTDPFDVVITAALGFWTKLNPKLTYIITKNVAVGGNKEGKSVYIYQLNAPYQMAMKKTILKFTGSV